MSLNGKRRSLLAGILGVVVIAVTLGHVIGGARAAGVPTMPPIMTYSGTLTDASGAPLVGTKNIQFQMWNQASGGTTPICLTASSPQNLAAGSFQIALPDTCATAIHAGGDLWTEVLVDGASLGRTKVGAVPFALEADTASKAAGALDARLNGLMPPKSVITANLTAADVTGSFDATGLGKNPGPYVGWAICNGNNGTPNLTNRFVRINTAGAGATGGSDNVAAHSHSIDHDHAPFTSGVEAGHVHATPNHQHIVPIGFDGANLWWTADSGDGPLFGSTVITANRAAQTEPARAVGLTRLAFTDNSGAGTTAAGSAHAHPVDPPAFTGTSGAAPAGDNRPAYYELVALMRL